MAHIVPYKMWVDFSPAHVAHLTPYTNINTKSIMIVNVSRKRLLVEKILS